MEYRVTWSIDIDADDSREAAERALTSIRRERHPGGAHVFEVGKASDVTHVQAVDLDEPGHSPDPVRHVIAAIDDASRAFSDLAVTETTGTATVSMATLLRVAEALGRALDFADAHRVDAA